MIKYYKEKETNDYLCVDTKTLRWYQLHFKKDYMEGRATAIKNNPRSVLTTGIHVLFLKEDCIPVKKKDVPKEYLDMF